MGKCSADFVLKDCMCLADPFDKTSTMCGYVSKIDWQVYPCSPGCCEPSCKNTNPDMSRLEVRPSGGVSLPPGFALHLPVTENFGAPPSRNILLTLLILIIVIIGLKIENL